MMKLAIQDFEGRTHYVPLKDGEYSIGRDDANQICLSDRNVSRQHARITARSSQIWIENVAATYGTRFNNLLLRERTEIQPGDVIEVGDYKLELVNEEKRDTALRDTSSADASARELPAAAPAGKAAPQASKGKAADGATAIVNLADISALLTKDSSGPSQAIPEASQPRLVVESDNLRGLELRLTKSPIVVGRVRESADLVIDHRSISKEHARLTRLPEGTWQVLDLGSANGIKVNGEPYSKSEIRSGDRLELGHVTLRFLAAGAKAPAGSVAPGRSGAKGGGALVLGAALAVVVLIGVAVTVVYLIGKKEPVAPDRPPAVDTSGATDPSVKSGEGGDKTDKTDKTDKADQAAKGDEKAEPPPAPAAAPPAASGSDVDGMLRAMDDKVAAGKYEEALAVIDALRVSKPDHVGIAHKHGEVKTLVALKRKLDQAEKLLDSDATKALDLAIDVQSASPSGSPLRIGASSIVEMAKNKIKGGRVPKVVAPRPDPPKGDKPDRPKDEPPKAAEGGKTGKELYDDAREALGASDWDRAIATARQALKAGYPKANTVLAKAYWGKGDKAGCLKYAEAAIKAGHDDSAMQGLVNKCQ